MHEATNQLDTSVTVVEPAQHSPDFDPLDKPHKPFPKQLMMMAVFLLVLVAGVSTWLWLNSHTSDSESLSEMDMVSDLQPAAVVTAFEYVPENTKFTPVLPANSANLSELVNLTNFAEAAQFSDPQKQMLNDKQFVVTQNTTQFYSQDPNNPTTRTDDWVYLYNQIGGGPITQRRPENAVFITTDFVFHVFHRLIEKELEYIERTTLYKAVSSLTDSLYVKAVERYAAAEDPLEKASFARLTAFFVVPKVMLDTSKADLEGLPIDTSSDKIETMLVKLAQLEGQMSPEAYQQAGQELNLIIEAKELKQSPLFGQLQTEAGYEMWEDYSQYQPRSHYNKNALLRTYFRTMMWYGRANFLAKSSELTRDALHICQFLQDEAIQNTWNSIAAPIDFLIGSSDDLSWRDYQPITERLGDDPLTALTVSKAIEHIGEMRNPAIQSSVIADPKVLDSSKAEVLAATKGFRLFGQRSVADAIIFSTLTQGQEEADPATGQKLPSSITGLFVMSALGLPNVEPLAEEWIKTNASNSDQVLAHRRQYLAEEFAKLNEKQWTSTIYWGWLYAIRALGLEPAEVQGYPAFMRSPEWQRKSLQTALGTWTELKHDTLLYAKQSYAEMGAGGDEPTPPPVPKGFVEPNVVVYDRLIALQKMKHKGLVALDLSDGVFEWRNQTLLSTLQFYRDLSVKELQAEPISDDEFEELRTSTQALMGVLAVLPGEEQTESAARTALIADVHTDAVKGQILYEATAIPDYIYVAVKDDHGARLTKGLVYRHHEFMQPLANRLTDEQWQGRIYQGTEPVPPLAPWTQALRP